MVIQKDEIAFNGLPDARSEEMFLHALAVRFVCQLFADLREVILPLGILKVR